MSREASRAASMPEAALLMSNFSNATGFAWTFIFRIQNAIARALHTHGCGIELSFAAIEGEIHVLEPSIPFHAFVFDPARASPRDLARLLKRLRRQRVRYVYLTDRPTWHWTYLLMRAAGVRSIVVHVHASVPDPNPAPDARGWRRTLKSLLHRTPLAADAVIAVSEFVAQRLIRQGCCPPERVAVILNGIDIDRLSPKEDRSANAPARVFMASRATRYKGVQVLIEATYRLRSRTDLPSFVVEYAGDGPDLAHFRDLVAARHLDEVFRFLGRLDDTSQLMCRADIVVVPSVWGDAFPLAVQEGMAAGRPVVASRAGGIPEITGEEGAAVLVPPGDTDALAEALAGLLRDPERRRRIGREARRRAERLFREDRFHTEVVARVLTTFGLASPANPPN